MAHRHSVKSTVYVRNFVFGVEDSLVSTVGVLSGIAIANVPRATILLTGVVLIFVEAFSMGVGSFLTEHSVEDYAQKKQTTSTYSVSGAMVMFCSYFFAGLIPLTPYILFPVGGAFFLSIGFSLLALFFLGVVSGTISHVNVLRSGVRMFVIGGIAVVVGAVVGKLLNF